MKQVSNCIACGVEFPAKFGSIGYCSDYCEDARWVEQKSEKKKEDNKIEKERGESMQTQSGEKINLKEKNWEDLEIQKKIEGSVPSITQKIESEFCEDKSLINRLDHSESLHSNLKTDILDSMNTLNDLNKELMTSMKRVLKNDVGTMALYDTDRVRVASECGKQIVNVMRAKLDFYKFGKDLMRDIKDETIPL